MKRKMVIYIILLLFSFALSFSSVFSREQQSKPYNQVPDTLTTGNKLLPSGYESLLDNVLNYQFLADSLMKVADYYRNQLKDVPEKEKPDLKKRISEIEKLSSENQKLANAVLGKGINKYSFQPENVDTGSSISEKKVISKPEKDTVIQSKKNEKVEKQVIKPVEIYSVFEVKINPVFASTDKIPINSEVPAGLIYRIQLAVFKNIVAPSFFKGITPVYGFKGAGSEMTNYYGGMFRKMSDASKALVKVKATGFRDAFVVPLLDKKIISIERAAGLEKEWGKRPLFTNPAILAADAPKDTIPPTLVFRVEVIRSPKPLSIEQLDVIKRLAGNRGFDVIINTSGQNIYLIGKFVTFESAAEYADLLTRNGQKEAKVAAYLGRREIPVETAKQLFEKN